MGFTSAFNYRSSAEIFREHAALSGFENDHAHGLRDFDISALADIDQVQFDALLPVQWPVTRAQPAGTERLFGDGRFFTASGKAQFVAVASRPPVNAPDDEYPFILNTGRLRDQWHTMTRTALAAKLNAHQPEPLVEIHPKDANRLGLIERGLALLESRWGQMLARVEITDAQRPGSLFVPMHWTQQFSSCSRVGAIVNPVVDPLSGQPESKQTPVRITAWAAQWQALLLSRQPLKLPDDVGYWVKIKEAHCWRYLLAGQQQIEDIQRWSLDRLDSALTQEHECLEYRDFRTNDFRAAQIMDNQLQSCIFFTTQGQMPDSGWLCGLFKKDGLSNAERRHLLSGFPPQGEEDVGRIVCSCFNVGEKTIRKAIETHHLTDSAGIGRCVNAGTGCGSCVPELKALIRSSRSKPGADALTMSSDEKEMLNVEVNRTNRDIA